MDATVWLMRAALSYNAQICGEVERFVILQGLDYPIRSNGEIDQFFEENPTKEFILAQNISDSVDKKQILNIGCIGSWIPEIPSQMYCGA